MPYNALFLKLLHGLVALAGLFFLNPALGRSEVSPELTSALKRIGPNSAVSVVDIDSGVSLVDVRGGEPLKPASVLKVLTSIVALEKLGPNFRFETFVSEYPVKGGYGLLIEGGGAPDFAIEDAWLLARAIRVSGRGAYEEVLLDDGAFLSTPARQGQRAYQTGPGALSFNYNSVTFKVCPTSAGRPARVMVDPWESGYTVSGTIQTGAKSTFTIDELRPGSFRARGMIASTAGCAEVYRSVTDPTAYFGAVFPQLLRSVGVSGKLLARRGAPPQNARPLTVARSKPLSQIVEDLNHFSNNFIAEQLLYALGGPRPYDRERGLGVLTDYLLELGVAASEIRLEDASGLSHENRLTARALTRLLRANLESVEVHPEFEVSLSVAGRSGTLRKRDFGVPDGRVRAKTGTLDGVSSLAGYLTTKRGRRLAFAILLNSMRDKQAALRIEDDLVRLLYQST